jgi:uncharacterized protein YecE (DUF72 family)
MIRVGTSGWRYPEWRGVFYPKGLPQRRELEYISRKLDTLEINGSFYSLQRPESYQRWYAETPDGFLFAVKGSRFITHMRRLRDVEAPLARFFASGVYLLRDKLGPVLWQLPPTFAFDPDRLTAFFRLLPRPTRHALEVRHPSFADPGFLDLLREHRIALVIADTAGRFPYLEDVTADFAYVRLHGDVELYASQYGSDALDTWAKRIRGLADAVPDVYVYFDNDIHAHAPFDALALAERLR